MLHYEIKTFLFLIKIYIFSMDKLHIIESQFCDNNQIVNIITSKFVSRHVIWNYLKFNNQTGDMNWQTVKYLDLKIRLIQYWEKRKVLNKHLSISQLGEILTSKIIFLNKEETDFLYTKLKNCLQEVVQNIETLHPMLIHHIIEMLFKLDKQEYQYIIDLLNKNVQHRTLLLLEQMIKSRRCTQMQKEQYLMLKGIDYHNIDEAFNKHYQSDRTKFILIRLKEKSKSL